MYVHLLLLLLLSSFPFETILDCVYTYSVQMCLRGFKLLMTICLRKLDLVDNYVCMYVQCSDVVYVWFEIIYDHVFT